MLAGLVLAVASEPPLDTVLARYVVTYVDTTGYHTVMHEDGHRTVTIMCPDGGDIVLTAEIWPEDLAEFHMMKQQMVTNKQTTEDVAGLVKELDSLLAEKKKK